MTVSFFVSATTITTCLITNPVGTHLCRVPVVARRGSIINQDTSGLPELLTNFENNGKTAWELGEEYFGLEGSGNPNHAENRKNTLRNHKNRDHRQGLLHLQNERH